MTRRFVTAALAALLILAAAAALRAEPPAAQQSITVEVTVIEVNRTKLRAVGFDWDLVSRGGLSDVLDRKFLNTTGDQLDGFLQALQQYKWRRSFASQNS